MKLEFRLIQDNCLYIQEVLSLLNLFADMTEYFGLKGARGKRP